MTRASIIGGPSLLAPFTPVMEACTHFPLRLTCFFFFTPVIECVFFVCFFFLLLRDGGLHPLSLALDLCVCVCVCPKS